MELIKPTCTIAEEQDIRKGWENPITTGGVDLKRD
jgi:hypothetical protein